MHLIIGLGNPGQQYKNTRHNIGFMIVGALADKLGLVWENNKKLKALLAKGDNLLLIKPLTFMNNSGSAVAAAMSYYKLLPKKLAMLKIKNADLSDTLTVIHDDLDLELGTYKISVDARSAGHRGVESIINHLKTKNFQRFRIGVKTPSLEKIPADQFVLQKFKAEEKTIIENLTIKIVGEMAL